MNHLSRYHANKTSWVLNAWVDTWLSPEFQSWNLDDVQARATAPVLAIHGAQDEYGSQRQPERIIRHCSGGEMLMLENCGHIPHREMPEPLLAHIAAFLASKH
ncbi:MAG: alpha/beta hydrolase [Micavibrio sp.]|nr:alpha/beta hydrolase [Micavibrio sp.]